MQNISFKMYQIFINNRFTLRHLILKYINMSDSAGQSASTGAAAGGEGASAQGAQTQSQTAQTSQADSPPVAKSEEGKTDTGISTEKQLHDLQKKIQGKFKDKKFDSDNDYYDVLSQELSQHEKYRDDNTKANERILKLFESNPELGDIIHDMDKGSSFTEAIARNVDIDSIKPYDDEPDYDGWEKAKKERLQKLDERKKQKADYDKNLDVSIKTFEDFGKKKNWTPEQAKEFTGKIDNVMQELSKGIISENFMVMMDRALNYVSDVQEAAETGEIKGRNTQIEVKRDAALKKDGDGLPDVKSSATTETKTEKEQEDNNPFSVAIKKSLEREKRAYGNK
jgi:hypothetical protein